MVASIIQAEITQEQEVALQNWLQANALVPGWLDGFGLGCAYIDPRSGKDKLAQRRAYVRIDRETARNVPELQGKSANEIRQILALRTDSEADGMTFAL